MKIKKVCITVDKWLIMLALTIFVNTLSFSKESIVQKPKKTNKKHSKLLDTLVITAKNDLVDYKGSAKRYFDLIHTRLELKPNFEEKTLNGIAILTLKPYFYNQSTIELDAKGMKILKVSTLDGKDSLTYKYDGKKLNIDLEKNYDRDTEFSLVIAYIAQPYLLDSATVEMSRGIYFINAENKNPYKPPHIWTQDETAGASCWFPTIDNTNERCTEEIFVTYPDTMVSFSNGLLINSVQNNDHTKTDYWKQDKPHAPYLFVLCIGPYKTYTEYWKNIPISYYTFEKYYPTVKDVFGSTSEMLDFFSDKLGVDYPWDKYSQLVAYDYTAGAMENTSASIFYEPLFATKKDLLDRDFNDIIAHELFHQWFGDLVTCESWGNLTLNESFADYSEYLWAEHKYGKDEAYLIHFNALSKYLYEAKNKKIDAIVNYYADESSDIFDNHRYEKGGRVINMLRSYLGDDAFFEGLKKYLEDNAFKAVELADLRKAMEEVSGEDLNWFFNQWWLSRGHPILNIKYNYDSDKKVLQIDIAQTQKEKYSGVPIFKLPIDIEIYTTDSTIDKLIWMTQKNQTFSFPISNKPIAIDFDKDKILLCEKNISHDEKTWITLFDKATNYIDKIESLFALEEKQNVLAVQQFWKKALNDNFWAVRQDAIELIDPKNWSDKGLLINLLRPLLEDKKSYVRKAALDKIYEVSKSEGYIASKTMLAKDSSYLVLAEALNNIRDTLPKIAYSLALPYKEVENKDITMAVAYALSDSGSTNDFSFFERAMWLQNNKSSNNVNEAFKRYLMNCNLATFEKGILLLADIIKYSETMNYIKKARIIIDDLTIMSKVGINSPVKYKEGKATLLEKNKNLFQ